MESLRALAANFDDIRVLLLYYWVESCFVAYTGLGLLGIRTELKNIIKVGIFHGIFVFLVRGLYTTFGIPFGTHTLILTIIMSLLVSKFCRLRLGIALTGSLVGMMVLVLGDSLILPHFHKMLGIPMEKVWENPWTHVMAGYVGAILPITAAFLISLTNFSLIRLRD